MSAIFRAQGAAVGAGFPAQFKAEDGIGHEIHSRQRVAHARDRLASFTFFEQFEEPFPLRLGGLALEHALELQVDRLFIAALSSGCFGSTKQVIFGTNHRLEVAFLQRVPGSRSRMVTALRINCEVVGTSMRRAHVK